MTIARIYEGTPVSMAVMSLAVAAAVALHVALLASWQQDPGHVMESKFVDPYVGPGRITVDVVPSTASAELYRLFHKDWATVRCDVSERGRLSNCSWVAQTNPGVGERAIKGVDGDYIYAGFGQTGYEFQVCMDNCPVY